MVSWSAARAAPARDAGVTLIEMIVAMAVMSVAAVAFTAGITQAHRVTNAVETRTDAGQQLSVAFRRLDREVAYAYAISEPGRVGGDWYVEYLTRSGSTSTCVELRLNTTARQLQQRTWAKASSPAPSGWLPLASEIIALRRGGVTVQPFTLLTPDEVVNYPRLQVAIAGRTGVTSLSQRVTTWAAMNATEQDPSEQSTVEDCADMRTVAP